MNAAALLFLPFSARLLHAHTCCRDALFISLSFIRRHMLFAAVSAPRLVMP